jgi:hypothetical protein
MDTRQNVVNETFTPNYHEPGRARSLSHTVVSTKISIGHSFAPQICLISLFATNCRTIDDSVLRNYRLKFRKIAVHYDVEEYSENSEYRISIVLISFSYHLRYFSLDILSSGLYGRFFWFLVVLMTSRLSMTNDRPLWAPLLYSRVLRVLSE